MTWRQVSMGALMVMKAALQGALLLYGSGVGYDREEAGGCYVQDAVDDGRAGDGGSGV
jgi:hypothetical protein